jgi:AP-3 complex subunit beta
MQILTSTMLKERSALTLGAVIVAFNALCPDRLELLHPHFRRLCRILVDMDEWGQVEAMGLLLRYARVMLVRPNEQEVGEEMLDKDLRLLLESVEPIFLSRNPAVSLIYHIFHSRIVYNTV